MKKNLFILTPKITFIVACIMLSSTFSSAQWVEKALGLRNRSEVASAVYGSKVYAFLGFSNADLQPEVSSEVYDPASDTWTLLASIPYGEARTHQGVVVVD